MRDFNPSNRPFTCLWCGRKIGMESIRNYACEPGEKLTSTVVGKRFSGQGDGYFCSLRCGYQFGTSLAVRGTRLQPK